MDNSEGQTYSTHDKNYNAEFPSEKERKHIDKQNVEMNNKSEQNDPQNGEVSLIGKQGESPSERQTHSTPNKIHDDCDMSANTEIAPEKETEQHINKEDEEDLQNSEANFIWKQGETVSESSSGDIEDDATPTDPQNGEVSLIGKQGESPSEGQTHSTPNKIHDDCDMSANTEIAPEKETEQQIDKENEEDLQNGEANFIEKQGETASKSFSGDIEDDATPTDPQNSEVSLIGKQGESPSEGQTHSTPNKMAGLAEFRRYPDGEASQSNVPDQSSKRRVEQAMECQKLVETFQKNGQYDEALFYCNTALNVLEFSQDTNLRMSFYSNIMQLYYLKGNIDAAMNTYYDHCDPAMEFVSDPKIIQSIIDMYNLCMKN